MSRALSHIGTLSLVVLFGSCIRVVPTSDLEVIATVANEEVKTGAGAIVNAVASRGWPPYVYRWNIESMPPDVNLDHTEFTAQTVSFAEFPQAGDYVLRVAATDSRGFRSYDFLTLSVVDPDPAEDFRVSISGPTELVLGEVSQLTAVTTFEGDLSFRWEIRSGEAELADEGAQTVNVLPTVEGDFVIRVTMSNNETGQQRAAEVTVTVFREDAFRVSIEGRATTEVDLATDYGAVVLNGSDDISYVWRKVSGPGALDTLDLDEKGSPSASFISNTSGTSVIEVTATDNEDGDVATASLSIRIVPQVELRQFFAEVGDPFLVQPGERVTVVDEVSLFFEGGEEPDPDDVTLSYAWEIVDGGGELEGADTQSPTLIAPPGGTSHLLLTVMQTSIGGRTSETTDNKYIVVLNEPNPVVVFEFEGFGTVRVRLDEEDVPGTVANFLSYVDERFYDGLTIHRVETTEREGSSASLIQGGGYKAENVPPAIIAEETHDPIMHEEFTGSNVRGTISMARTPAPDTATSQYFVNLSDNPFWDFGGDAGVGFVVFGEVIEGIENLDPMTDVPATFQGGIHVVDEPIIMTSVRRENP